MELAPGGVDKFEPLQFRCFSAIDKGVVTARRQAMQDDQQLAGFYVAAIGELFDAHLSVEIDPPRQD